MNEEKYIEDKVGKRNPFQVPEGYFDSFATQMMQHISAQPQAKAKTIWMRPIFYVAASVCALFICTTVWIAMPETRMQQQAPMAVVEQNESVDDFDEAADYLMLDNHDIYAYLSEN